MQRENEKLNKGGNKKQTISKKQLINNILASLLCHKDFKITKDNK